MTEPSVTTGRIPWDDAFERMVRRSVPDLPADTALRPDDDLRALGLTSMLIVALVLEIEGHYSIEFPEDQLLVEVCATPGRLWSVVDDLR